MGWSGPYWKLGDKNSSVGNFGGIPIEQKADQEYEFNILPTLGWIWGLSLLRKPGANTFQQQEILGEH